MRRAEEVGPHHRLRPAGGGGDRVYVERRGVRRQYSLRFRDLVEACEDVPLHLHVLEDRLHQEVGSA